LPSDRTRAILNELAQLAFIEWTTPLRTSQPAPEEAAPHHGHAAAAQGEKSKNMARKTARLKLGYYPLLENEAKRIRQFLHFPNDCAVLDPCAGTGRALELIAGDTGTRLYGIELDAFRAAEARTTLDEVVQGSTFDAHSPVESYSLLYLNPPYDDEVHEDRSRRSEAVFLEHCFRWLMPKGVLVLLIPTQRVGACSTILASHFRDLAMYRLTEPEAAQYKQVVLIGVRRSRYERERLKDRDFQAQRNFLSYAAAAYAKLSPLRDAPDRIYSVPAGRAAVRLTYTGLPFDAIEDLLPSSRAYREAVRSVFAPPIHVAGRPLTPLHEGQAGILSCSGLLNGVFGQDNMRHVACWQTSKKVDHIEETDDRGVTTLRDRECFTQSLTLIYADGRTAELSEDNDAKCAPTSGPA
jgi:SAM-dependent methyltransferase